MSDLESSYIFLIVALYSEVEASFLIIDVPIVKFGIKINMNNYLACGG